MVVSASDCLGRASVARLPGVLPDGSRESPLTGVLPDDCLDRGVPGQLRGSPGCRPGVLRGSPMAT